MRSKNNSQYNTNIRETSSNADIAETVRSGKKTTDGDMSPIETGRYTVRVELPVEEYAVLAKRAAQEGVSAEVLVAQAVGKLLQ
ncbi:MAG: hypothetical protein IJE66_07985 [Akkermansia sp.]|nr:hypothetical protein [Akkermansia sp.]